MSDRAQRVLDALMEYDANEGIGYPLQTIYSFLKNYNSGKRFYSEIEEDYEELTAEEERQVIEAFLENSY